MAVAIFISIVNQHSVSANTPRGMYSIVRLSGMGLEATLSFRDQCAENGQGRNL